MDFEIIGEGFMVPEGPVAAGHFISTIDDQRLVFQITEGRATTIQSAANAEALRRTSLINRPLTLMILAALTGAASVATLAGLVMRNRRDLRSHCGNLLLWHLPRDGKDPDRPRHHFASPVHLARCSAGGAPVQRI